MNAIKEALQLRLATLAEELFDVTRDPEYQKWSKGKRGERGNCPLMDPSRLPMGSDPADIFGQLKRVAGLRDWPVIVTREPGETLSGHTDWREHTITIDDRRSPVMKCSVLAHEMAHTALHCPFDEAGEINFMKLIAKKIMGGEDEEEVEAGVVAWLVTQTLGVEGTAAFELPYILTWGDGISGALQHVLQSAERIVDVAAGILEDIRLVAA